MDGISEMELECYRVVDGPDDPKWWPRGAFCVSMFLLFISLMENRQFFSTLGLDGTLTLACLSKSNVTRRTKFVLLVVFTYVRRSARVGISGNGPGSWQCEDKKIEADEPGRISGYQEINTYSTTPPFHSS